MASRSTSNPRAQTEVRPSANGLGQVGVGDTLAPAVHDRESVERRPRHVPPIVVTDRTEPEFHPGQAMGPGERVRPGRLAEPYGTLSSVAIFGGEGRGLRTNEIGPHGGPVPPGSACLGPPVEIYRVAADMTHCVHRAASAHRATPRPGMCAACRAALRHGREIPVDRGALQKRPGGGIGNVEVRGLSARFQQEHTQAGIFRKPGGKHAACRPCPDDDDVRLCHARIMTFYQVTSRLPSAGRPNRTVTRDTANFSVALSPTVTVRPARGRIMVRILSSGDEVDGIRAVLG